MKVIQVVQHLQPGGIETLALDLLQTPHAQSSICVSLEGTADAAIAAWPRLAAFRDQLVFMNKPPGRSWTVVSDLLRLIKANAANVVHTHHIGPLLYGGVAARIAGAALIHTEHDAWHLEAVKRRILMRALVSGLQPKIAADAKTVAKQFRRRLHRTVDAVIYNGVDLDKFSPGDKQKAREMFSIPCEAPVVGFSGRLETVKGCDIAIEALARSGRKDLILAVAGDGAQRAALQRQAVTRGLKERVVFLGRIDAMPSFYRAIDVLALTSRAEGMPLSLLEAQACGACVIAADVGAVREAVCDRTGQLAPPGDIDAFAALFARYFSHAPARSDAAQKFARAIADRSAMWAHYAALAA